MKRRRHSPSLFDNKERCESSIEKIASAHSHLLCVCGYSFLGAKLRQSCATLKAVHKDAFLSNFFFPYLTLRKGVRAILKTLHLLTLTYWVCSGIIFLGQNSYDPVLLYLTKNDYGLNCENTSLHCDLVGTDHRAKG